MIQRLTGEVQAVFGHPTVADRVANMLNYFLKMLVGPQRKKFKVEDQEGFEFK